MRQGGRQTVHFDDGFGPVCRSVGAELNLTGDVLEVDCGSCERTPAFREAWSAEHR